MKNLGKKLGFFCRFQYLILRIYEKLKVYNESLDFSRL